MHGQDIGCRTTYENKDVLKHSDIVILAVKPPIVPQVLADISSFVTPKHLMISIAAGIKSNSIEKLSEQVELFESELENLQTTQKKSKKDREKQERHDCVKNRVEKHRYHIKQLETLMRMLDNETVEVEQIKKIKDDIEYYIESSQDTEFQDNEYIYDDLDLEDMQAFRANNVVDLTNVLAGAAGKNSTGSSSTKSNNDNSTTSSTANNNNSTTTANMENVDSNSSSENNNNNQNAYSNSSSANESPAPSPGLQQQQQQQQHSNNSHHSTNTTSTATTTSSSTLSKSAMNIQNNNNNNNPLSANNINNNNTNVETIKMVILLIST